ncbi:ABA4-like family protein [Streptomyces sp. NPDC054796]
MTETLFELSFLLAAPFWALMILAPGRRLTDRIAASPLPMVPVLLVYLALAAPVFGELWTAVRSPDLGTWQELLALPGGAGAVWAQVIAWDLFLGQWMYREARALGISALVMGPVLVLSILLSPIGVAVFLLLRAVKRRVPAPPERNGDAAHHSHSPTAHGPTAHAGPAAQQAQPTLE